MSTCEQFLKTESLRKEPESFRKDIEGTIENKTENLKLKNTIKQNPM